MATILVVDMRKPQVVVQPQPQQVVTVKAATESAEVQEVATPSPSPKSAKRAMVSSPAPESGK